MAVYRELSGSAPGLRIEVEDLGGSGADPTTEALTQALGALVAAVVEGTGAIPEEQRPDAIEIEFALKALSSGVFAVSGGGAGANLRVVITLGGAGEALSAPPDPASFT